MQYMDDNSLGVLLRNRRESPPRKLPGAFRQNVWRAIHERSASDEREETASVWQWFLRPQMVTAVLAVAVTVGVGLGSQVQDLGASNARNALDLNVFTDRAPALPSTLLASDL